jgi:hypothetical protein
MGHATGGDGTVGPPVGADSTHEAGREEEGRAGADDDPVALEEPKGTRREHDGASLVALAASDVDEARTPIDVVDLQGGGLGDAQAGGEHDGEEGVVIGRRRQQGEEVSDLGAGEGAAGEPSLDAGTGDVVEDVEPADAVEEALQGGVVDGASGGGAAGVGEVEEEGADVLGGEGGERGWSVVPEKDGGTGEVLADGAVGQTAKPEVVP